MVEFHPCFGFFMSVQADRFESFQKKMSFFFSKSSFIFVDVIGGPSPIIRFLQKINTLNKTQTSAE